MYDIDHILMQFHSLTLHYVLKDIAMKENEKVSIEFRIWFFCGDKKLVGKGRVELLELIKKTGSITNAAKGMSMSYRQAWQMVQEMNERASSPLVEKKMGGKTGGGAMVTQKGEDFILAFYEIDQKIRSFIEEESKNLKL
jgi:molybdate transport system regulatory protein